MLEHGDEEKENGGLDGDDDDCAPDYKRDSKSDEEKEDEDVGVKNDTKANVPGIVIMMVVVMGMMMVVGRVMMVVMGMLMVVVMMAY